MKKILTITTMSFLLSSLLIAQPNMEKDKESIKSTQTIATDSTKAQELFKAKCSTCHITTRPINFSNLVAPPIMGVMRHVKMSYPQKDKAVAFMKDYILNPSKDKAICMPQKIKRFGLMPSQKGAVTPEELDIILPWIFDKFPPKGFRGMGHNSGVGLKLP